MSLRLRLVSFNPTQKAMSQPQQTPTTLSELAAHPVVRAYRAALATAGGKGGKGTKARRKANKRATAASWTKEARKKRLERIAQRKIVAGK